MISKKPFKTIPAPILSAYNWLFIIILLPLFYLTLCSFLKVENLKLYKRPFTQNVYYSNKTWLVNNLTTAAKIIDFTNIHLTDSIPVKKNKGTKTYKGYRIKKLNNHSKNNTGGAKKKVKIINSLDAGNLSLETGKFFPDFTALHFRLSSLNIHRSADSSEKLFFNFLHKYYHLSIADSAVAITDSNNIAGLISLSAIHSPNRLMETELVDKQICCAVIGIDSFRFKSISMGNTYTIFKQQANLDPSHIYFKNFLITDTLNNTIIVNGALDAALQMPAKLDLKLTAKNFTLLKIQKAIGNQLYGYAAVNGSALVSGTILKPSITGDLVLNDGAAITLILPQNNLNKAAAISAVSFKKNEYLNEMVNILAPIVPKNDSIKEGGKLNLNLRVTAASTLNFIIDPAAGDELNLNGNGLIKVMADSAGSLLLSGNYKLDSGYYRLNNQYLQRQFKILTGSSIAFNGAVANAVLAIKAAYTIKTSAYDLLKNEIGYLDRYNMDALKKDLAFKVFLNLTGPIHNLKMGFTIALDSTNNNLSKLLRTAIENKLNQLGENVSVTNKQIFSLLLYSRFVGEQSDDFFNSAGAGGTRFDDRKYQSLSGFLTSAIDNIAEDLFKTLDIYHNLNNYKDYGNGDAQQKTEANIGATKSFINDRVSINVGKNYGIDGQDASAKAAQQKGAGFLPDVTLVYKFTRDGKYRYRSYKKNQFEVTVDGYVTESGVSVLINLDYDKFSDLFKKYAVKMLPN